MKKTVLKNKKKMIYDMISSREYVPMRAREMAVLLQIPKGRRKELEEVLGRRIRLRHSRPPDILRTLLHNSQNPRLLSPEFHS